MGHIFGASCRIDRFACLAKPVLVDHAVGTAGLEFAVFLRGAHLGGCHCLVVSGGIIFKLELL